MDQKKLISVIIPTYNSEKYIYKCISSVLSQTYKNYEVIIIDNNSTDITLKIINSFNTNKIKIFNVNNEGNISISRNLGIKNSNGSWISFLDSDDFWDKEKLNTLSKKFDDYDFIFHEMNILKNNKIINKFDYFFQKFDVKKITMIENLCKKGNPILNSSVIVKKNILYKVGLLSENQPSFTNDYHTWLKISLLTNKFYYDKKKLGSYSIHDSNFSHNIKNSYFYLKCVTQFKKYLSNEVKIKIIGYYNHEKGKELQEKGKILGSLKCFFKSILLSDINIKFKSLIRIILYLFKKT